MKFTRGNIRTISSVNDREMAVFSRNFEVTVVLYFSRCVGIIQAHLKAGIFLEYNIYIFDSS